MTINVATAPAVVIVSQSLPPQWLLKRWSVQKSFQTACGVAWAVTLFFIRFWNLPVEAAIFDCFSVLIWYTCKNTADILYFHYQLRTIRSLLFYLRGRNLTCNIPYYHAKKKTQQIIGLSTFFFLKWQIYNQFAWVRKLFFCGIKIKHNKKALVVSWRPTTWL